jgi:hypothetical protein
MENLENHCIPEREILDFFGILHFAANYEMEAGRFKRMLQTIFTIPRPD